MVQSYSPGCINVHPNLMHASLEPRVHIPNGISIGSSVFAGLITIVTDRPTDRQITLFSL